MRSAIACLLLAAANAGTSPEGKTWLEAKAKEDGVVTLESGLMYKVLRDGDGENHPKASTSCECHYEGKLIDGTVFDSSYERGSPTSFAPNQVIKGWTEAMQLMVEGCVEINQWVRLDNVASMAWGARNLISTQVGRALTRRPGPPARRLVEEVGRS